MSTSAPRPRADLPLTREVALTADNGEIALALLNAQEPQPVADAVSAAYRLLGALFTHGANEAEHMRKRFGEHELGRPDGTAPAWAARFDGEPGSYRRRHLEALREVLDHLAALGAVGGAR